MSADVFHWNTITQIHFPSSFLPFDVVTGRFTHWWPNHLKSETLFHATKPRDPILQNG